jgi:alkylation response protein AidB-like acyl-CoA dehydrogenase
MDLEQKKLLEELLSSKKKSGSFAKKLSFSLFDPTGIFPYFQPSSEVKEKTETFLKKLSDFAAREIDPDKIDRESKIPDSVIQGLASLGVFGLTVPKEYGGQGFGYTAYCKVTETLAKRCASTTLLMNVHVSIGLNGLLLFGTEEQKKAFLPKMAKGEAFGAFSLTEPEAGSDAAAVKTSAEWIPEKNCYRINGVKQWSTNASIAKVLTVMARTGEKISAFIVTPDMPGFIIRDKALDKVGFRGTWTANLAFENMDVPKENLLGPLGGGLKVALSVLDYGRTTFGAMCTGVAKQLLERAIEHSKTRIQFKRHLCTFGLVKQKISKMAALVYAMDATTYVTAGLIDQKVEDIMLESTMLKVFASEALWDTIYDTMQIFGGRSLFKTEPFERNMRDARLNQIGEGSNDVMRAFIAVVGLRDLGVLLKELWEKKKIGKLVRHLLFRLKIPKIAVQSKELQKEVAFLSRAIRRFGISSIALLATYKEDVAEQQLCLARLSDILIAIYTTTAVLAKCDFEKKDFDIAKFYCKMAQDKINQNFDALFSKDDKTIYALSDRLTKGAK